jgi:hypothetical protein
VNLSSRFSESILVLDDTVLAELDELKLDSLTNSNIFRWSVDFVVSIESNRSKKHEA